MMPITRRRLFGILPAAAAGAASLAFDQPSPPHPQPALSVIVPRLLERTCDGGWKSCEEFHAADQTYWEQTGARLWEPCWIRFQFWFGGGTCYCPECGRAYQVTMDDVKAGRNELSTHVQVS